MAFFYVWHIEFLVGVVGVVGVVGFGVPLQSNIFQLSAFSKSTNQQINK
ncbi:MAG: hypothetical protein ACI93R_003267 [Flavobacteriales bacterium]